MREIDLNREAWRQVAADHYHAYKKKLLQGAHQLNAHIREELGDLSGKEIIHLQSNTGADSLLLARMSRRVVGVDLVPENIYYAKKLASDLQIGNADFFTADIMELMQQHNEQYDVVFVSEGAIGWLPDLRVWARTIRHLLRDDGFLYVFDSHPFYLTFDERKLAGNILEIKYPYFSKEPDVDDTIGGYASEAKSGVQAYFWMYTVSDIINALISAGLSLDYFNEFEENFFDAGGQQRQDCRNLYNYSFNKGLFPMSFSARARPVQASR